MLFGDRMSLGNQYLSILGSSSQDLQKNLDSPSPSRKWSRAVLDSLTPEKPSEFNHSHSILSASLVSEIKSSSHSAPITVEVLSNRRDRNWVIDRIEDVFEHQIDSIVANNGHLAVNLKTRTKTTGVQSFSFSRFEFPGRSEKDTWRYTVIIRILELLYEALRTETLITKREIYYRDPALFTKQAVVNRFVDDLAFTFGVPRLLLNVTATAKGLIAGSFTIQKSDGGVIDGRVEREGTLISPLKDDESIDTKDVHWILIVEKEATFRSLVSSSFWDCVSLHGLVITGKGYPDIATRLLLRSIVMPSRHDYIKQMPIYALVDYDPDGMDILSTYKHGSAALAHQKAELELPSIQWLGLRSRDLGEDESLHQSQGLLRLSDRDRWKGTRMLGRDTFTEDGKEPAWRCELQIMLFLNIKAEIQVLEAQARGLPKWLETHGLI